MWRKNDTHDLPTRHNHHKEELEIFKAVSQAWLSHHNANPSTLAPNEFDARRLNFHGQPSRFRLEALRTNKSRPRCSNWDFNQSLWDPYEIVAVSKRLEEGLVLDNGFPGLFEEGERGVLGVVKKRKESKNSLRSLFSMVSGRSKNG